MTERLDIEGLDRAEIIAALHNATRALGMGALHDIRREMTPEDARTLFQNRPEALEAKEPLWLDYVCGRPLKVYLTEKWLERTDLFDRDATGGAGSCARVIEELRRKAQANAPR